MRRVISIATATVLALFLGLTNNVAGQQPDTRDRTIMTFSGAVELPGMRLEPGTYVFRLADTASRNVIQVLSADEMQMLGQWLFVPAERLDVTGDTVVTFRETRANATPAVQFWYYPGEKIGKEFIYPKDQALRIAQRTGASVLTEEGPVSAGAQASARTDTQVAPAQEQGIGVVEGSGLPKAQAEVQIAETQTEVQIAPAQEQGAVAVGTTGADDQVPGAAADTRVRQESTLAQAQVIYDELPRTASPLGLASLLGLLSLAGAAGFRALRR
jgi:hypothetical protein